MKTVFPGISIVQIIFFILRRPTMFNSPFTINDSNTSLNLQFLAPFQYQNGTGLNPRHDNIAPEV